jgi:hypothetical protein
LDIDFQTISNEALEKILSERLLVKKNIPSASEVIAI